VVVLLSVENSDGLGLLPSCLIHLSGCIKSFQDGLLDKGFGGELLFCFTWSGGTPYCGEPGFS
jgi:hypothetical protein